MTQKLMIPNGAVTMRNTGVVGEGYLDNVVTALSYVPAYHRLTWTLNNSVDGAVPGSADLSALFQDAAHVSYDPTGHADASISTVQAALSALFDVPSPSIALSGSTYTFDAGDGSSPVNWTIPSVYGDAGIKAYVKGMSVYLTAQALNVDDASGATYTWALDDASYGTFSYDTSNHSACHVVFTNPGQYNVTLSVALGGKTSTYQVTVSVDRVLFVGGSVQGCYWFTSIKEAFDWIDANDSSNAGKYLIEVMADSTYTDSRISPNAAKVHIHGGVTLKGGFDLAAGTTYYWFGDNERSQISLSTGSVFTGGNSTGLYLLNVLVVAGDTSGVPAISLPGTAVKLYLKGTRVSALNASSGVSMGSGSSGTKSSLQMLNSSIEIFGSGYALHATYTSVTLHGSLIYSSLNGVLDDIVYLDGCVGSVVACHIYGGNSSTSVALRVLRINATASGTLTIAHTHISQTSGASTVNNGALSIEGSTTSVRIIGVTAISTGGSALIRVSTAGTNYYIALCYFEGTNSVLSTSSNGLSISSTSWSSVQMFLCVLKGSTVGTLSMATSSALGTNIQA